MNELKRIYCISGLGADFRIFRNLKLPSEFTLDYLPWIDPVKDERIESYAARLAKGIADNEPVIMGVSLGGMIAVEISKLMEVGKIIIISSIKTRKEKPFYFRAAAELHLNQLLRVRPYNFLSWFENYNLGIKTAEEKKLASEYRQNYNVKFGNWAIDRIIHWENEVYPPDIIHIHGSKDHILPVRYLKPTYLIDGGGHMMIMNKSEEISKIISGELKRIK